VPESLGVSIDIRCSERGRDRRGQKISFGLRIGDEFVFSLGHRPQFERHSHQAIPEGAEPVTRTDWLHPVRLYMAYAVVALPAGVAMKKPRAADRRIGIDWNWTAIKEHCKGGCEPRQFDGTIPS
jgi:hypothetical protein